MDLYLDSIIKFIKDNNLFFYEKISDFYIENIFQDNRGEREIFISINEYNCRYNACLIYTILNFIEIKNIKINDIISDEYYSDFQKIVISNFSNPFFQDSFTTEQIYILKKYNNINNNNNKENCIIIFLFELEESYTVSHMVSLIKDTMIDSYRNINYKRSLELRTITSLDNILNEGDKTHHNIIDSYVLFIPYSYLKTKLVGEVTNSIPSINYLKKLKTSNVRKRYEKSRRGGKRKTKKKYNKKKNTKKRRH